MPPALRIKLYRLAVNIAMEIISLKFDNMNLKENLLPYLKDTIFHLTSLKAYEQILSDGEIKNNKDNKFSLNTGSAHSLGRKNGWVCLFNLKNINEEIIDKTLSGPYNFLDPTWFSVFIKDKLEGERAYFILDDNYHHLIIDNEIAKGTIDQHVQKIECWMDDKIPLDYIAKVLLVKSTRSVPKGSHEHFQLFSTQQTMLFLISEGNQGLDI